MRTFSVAALAVLLAAFAWTQPASREVRLTLREGTSMAAALSPDGRTIVIDLLGALWTVPPNGGVAARLLEDGYDARQPAWSPDGTRLAFQAYRTGTWDIWTIGRNGGDPKPITWGPFDDREPHWSPDGTRIAFASDRGGSYDIWVVTLATGDVARVTSQPSNEFMPAWSPDGARLAYVSDRREHPGIYAIPATDGAVPEEQFVAGVPGALAGPSWSPDGRTLAFNATEGRRSRLLVGEADVADADEDVFPFRPQWTSGSTLLYTADGKIKRRPASGGAAEIVELSAAVAFSRPAFTPKPQPLVPAGPQIARGIMHPAISPDGARIAFAALGDLWTVPVAGGSPERLTRDAFVETDPAWSPDGAVLAFSTDRDGSMDIWVRDLKSSRDRKLATDGRFAAWSPDSGRLAFLDSSSQLQVVEVATGRVTRVHAALMEPGRPTWAPDGRALIMSALKPYSARFREGTNQLLRVSLDGQPDRWIDPVPHKSIGMREDHGPVWAPDGTQMAATIDGHLVLFPVTRGGEMSGPPRRMSAGLANSPSWTADSRHVLYQSDEGLRLVNVLDGSTREIAVQIAWSPTSPADTYTVHAGRLFDARAARLRENVDIVVTGNRITRVDAHRDALHDGRVVDASQQTVLPGLIESHAHLAKGFGERLGRMFLSFGVTTVRNPAANPFEGQEDREAILSGARIGPRVLTTGGPLDGTRIYYPGGTALDGGAQLGEELARAERLGFDFIKTYVRLPDLLQKRAIDAAHRVGMAVTSHELYPAAAYGADGVEHIRGTSRRGYTPKASALNRSYADVIDLLAATKMTLTPTIGIVGGNQLFTIRDPRWLDDPRVQQFVPARALSAIRAFSRQTVTPDQRATREALVGAQEKTAAAVLASGGRIIAGTDSPIIPYGMALLMELEHFVNGGMSAADALRSATIVPAEAMGLDRELGTLEAGKLADLAIVDGNPLADIRDARRTVRVIMNGVVHEMQSLLRGAVQRAPSFQ